MAESRPVDPQPLQSSSATPPTATAERGRVVQGQVLGPSGAPIAGARVSLVVSGGGWNWGQHLGPGVTTDAHGRFILRRGQQVAREIWISARGLAPKGIALPRGGPTRPEARIDLGVIALQSPGAIRGRVSSESAKDVRLVAVTRLFGLCLADVHPDERGEFELRDLPRQGLLLVVLRGGKERVALGVDLSVKRVLHVLLDPPQVRGRSRASQLVVFVPLRDLTVRSVLRLTDLESGLPGLLGIATDHLGRFEGGGVPPGRYLMVRPGGALEVQLPPQGQAPLEVNVEAAQLSGRMVARAGLSLKTLSISAIDLATVRGALRGEPRALLELSIMEVVGVPCRVMASQRTFAFQSLGRGEKVLLVEGGELGSLEPCVVDVGRDVTPELVIGACPGLTVDLTRLGTDILSTVILNETGLPVSVTVGRQRINRRLPPGDYQIHVLTREGRTLRASASLPPGGDILVRLDETLLKLPPRNGR